MEWAAVLARFGELTTFHGVRFFYEVARSEGTALTLSDRSRVAAVCPKLGGQLGQGDCPCARHREGEVRSQAGQGLGMFYLRPSKILSLMYVSSGSVMDFEYAHNVRMHEYAARNDATRPRVP
ncbi:hypothetical protein BC628DRAFT_1376626 [Trametes gibbosa]|nr:hypothetical protein BC628DRAFT_1376626 [Trametes gibbosa]